MSLKINKPLVSVDWLYNHLNDDNIVVLDCTIPKVTSNTLIVEEKTQIKGAVFFDIKNSFSDRNAALPNTVLSPEEFEIKAQELGINKDTVLVCYDDLGIYSSPRVWWMFQLMGFKNIVVLNGGFPEWKLKGFPIEIPKLHQQKNGNFKVNYKPEKLKYTKDVLISIENKKVLIVDARSNGRFLGTAPEPRKDLKSGHIPNAISLPFEEVLLNGKIKTEPDLVKVFSRLKDKNEIIFTCGSGITAAILALGAAILNIKNVAVYDGSWTEWGSTDNLPIAL